jgi:predicted small secreted protein
MKKIAVTVAVLALGLAACGTKTENAVDNDTNLENAAEADVNASTNDAANAADNALDAAGNAIDSAGNAVENAGAAVDNAADNAM